MARQYKCAVCSEFDLDANMVIEKIGSSNRRIHKENCHDEYIKDQEFKRKEKTEWDNCYSTIKDVCEVELIPPSFVGLIQRLRNGDPVIGMRKDNVRHFKQGFAYPVIQQAYLEKSDLIKWKKSTWDGSNGRFLTFVLVYYILDIIENVQEDMLRKDKQDKKAERVNHVPVEEINFKHKTKTDDESDISNFI